MTDFPAVALQSFLGSAAILFGIFGLLYSVYATASLQITPTNPQRPPIVKTLRRFCKVIAALGIVNAGFTIYSLYLILPTGNQNLILSLGILLVVIIPAIMSGVIAFFRMD